MLNVIIVAEKAAIKQIHNKLQQIPNLNIMTAITPAEFDHQVAQKYKADFVITATSTLVALCENAHTKAARTQVKAVTHQGIRFVPIENVYYFQAEHKYVTVVHTHGQLLIEDTLNSLEQEFSGQFIRIHRKFLVAIALIESLQKDNDGQYWINLRGSAEPLMVSRRQVAHVRKVLSWL